MAFETLDKSELLELVRGLDSLITEAYTAYLEDDFKKVGDLVSYAAGRLEAAEKSRSPEYQPLSPVDEARLQETRERAVEEARKRGAPRQPNAAEDDGDE